MGVSGSVDFPEYMKIVHADWVAGTDVAGTAPAPDKVTKSVTTCLEAAHGANPFTAATAFNPSTQLANMLTSISTYSALVTAINPQTDWAGFVLAAVADETGVTEFDATLEDALTTRALPAFWGGMRDINAVNSSAFLIGESVLRAFKARDVANFQAKKVLDNIKEVMKLYLYEIEAAKVVMATQIDVYRLNIVASKEQADRQVTIDEGAGRWDLEVFQYAANLIAGISGSSAGAGSSSAAPSSTRSAIGGALSGAALGYNIGGGKGAAVGAGIGLLGGLLD